MSSFPPAPAPARSPSPSSPNASTPIQPPPTSLPPLFSSSPPPPSTPALAPSPALSSHNATAPPPSSPLQPPPLNSPAPSPSPSQPPLQSPLHGGGVALPPPPSTRFKFRPATYPPPGASGSSSAKGVSMGIIVVGTMAGVILIVMIIVLVVVCSRKGKNNQDAPPSPPPPPMGRLYNPPPRKLNPKPGVERIPKPWNIPFPPLSQLTPINVDSFSTSSENWYSPKTTRFSSGNFTIEELVASTANFSPENLLGEGGFGYVHKGVLPNGRRIAVKRLKLGSRQGEREFQAEVETISRVHHGNLVSMVGYCMTGAERLLVYEFVPNNTLEFHLHGKDQPVMKWATRMKIAIGSAKGLAYLHEDCNPTIIHRDIKASNILLDSKFEAKVADFGLAKFFSDTNHDITHVYTRVVGTFGLDLFPFIISSSARYLAPEYAASGRASDKTDVFSFGVMLLELITGRKPLSTTDCLLSWARPLLKKATENRNFDALVDRRLQKDYNNEEMGTMVACATACVRNSEWRRPRMSQIIRTLEGDVSLSDLDEGIKPE